jgi:glycosyltransferase involved in cell wall biosynthesis
VKPISISIFFPAYNEEENISLAVEKTVRVVEESPYIRAYEIIIVNDGSTDGTLRIAESLARKYPTVRVVNHDVNRGYGAALQSGLAAATMDYVFFTDADLQFDILELQNLVVHIPEHDAVIGYRAPRRDPFMRLINAWGWNTLNRLFFGLKVTDIDCAFKLFRREKVQALRLKSRGAMISAETLIRLTRSGARIKEIPVSHLPRLYGSATGARLSVIFRAFREMVGLYRNDLGLVTHKQVLKFMTVGVLNTALDLVGYILLTRYLGFGSIPTAAKFFSFMLGTISSLFLNRAWTFGVITKLSFAEVACFYAVVSMSITLNVGLMYFFVHMVGLYDLVALALTTALTFTANYTLSKIWVFRKSTESAADLVRQN